MNKKFTSKGKLLISALAVLGSGNVIAEEVMHNVTVTVNNEFSFIKETDISFGEVAARASTSDGDVAKLTLNPDGTTSTFEGTESFIHTITAPTPGAYTVTAAAPNTDLTITYPDTVTLTTTSGTTTFTVDNWSARVTSGTNTDTLYDENDPNLTTDDVGGVTFSMGATLSTDERAEADGNTEVYESGEVYSGSYTLTVNY